MNVDTGQFQALTAEVAKLAAQVQRVGEREFTVDAAYRAGYGACREAMLGRAARTSRVARPRGSRSSHLRVVDGGFR